MTDATTPRPTPAEPPSLAALRRVILALFYLSIPVLAGELLLLEHTESLLQLVPFLGLGAGALVVGWLWLRPGRAALLVTRLAMIALMVVGVVGLYLHYRANVEFELEMRPDLSGWALFSEAIRGAMPALAPGLMGQLGLLGLAYTFRHPAGSPRPHHQEDWT